MKRRTVFTAIGLIMIGVVIGVVGMIGAERSNGTAAEEIRLVPQEVHSFVPNKSEMPHPPMSQTFVTVAKLSTPTVVSIQVKVDEARPDALDFLYDFQEDEEGDAEHDEKEEMERKKDMFHWFFRSPTEPMLSSGSGVLISRDGYIMTNHHVVKNASSASNILVTLHDKREFHASITGTDPLTDIAIIKIDAKNLSAATFGNSDSLHVGEWVMAVGNPFELTSTVTAGIISAMNRNINIIHDSFGVETFIQTDAVINPGNSGGALVNMNGQLIGINTAIASRNGSYQGYGFAIPINLAQSVAKDLIAHGEVIRGYIGVSLGEIDAVMAKALGLKQPTGALIQEVLPECAAKEAGIESMDVILKIDGVQIAERNQLQAYVARKHPGDVLRLQVWRDKKIIELRVKLKALKKNSPVAKLDAEPKEEDLGMEVANLSQEEKKEFRTEHGIRVISIDPFGSAFTRGIEKNDLILEINREKIASVQSFNQKLVALKSEEAILLKIRKPYSQSAMFVAVEVPH
ncbi:protease Do [Chloroherpeton thalassium ATCC 35110]|uniref:Protease Do n=1 Tax=Chloroherpeton thalassium (strain ATCC 35110 / GB-78) TaxID=517418 RepID=B3QU21_CHLT3|nr:Do family serine endopeptidase [Chloroherpeton thalassium]ACF12819.1 protease Do [Chloroherpeton thalassium ATCC 35110]